MIVAAGDECRSPQSHSAAVKDITVIYKQGAVKLARQLFGDRPADGDLARLAGVLDGATVIVSARKKKNWLYLSVNDPRFDRYESEDQKFNTSGCLIAPSSVAAESHCPMDAGCTPQLLGDVACAVPG
ncbi:MAG: hypothetical protein ACRD9Y_23040 [Blastocatellia bacterium]